MSGTAQRADFGDFNNPTLPSYAVFTKDRQ